MTDTPDAGKAQIETFAAKPELNREIATIANGQDITRGYLAPLLVTQDMLLLARAGGNLELYENVRSDPVVHSAMQQRRLAIIKCEWQVEPGGPARADKKAADFLREQLQNVGWDRVTGNMHWGTFYGYSVAELIYGREGANITLDAIKVRNRRRFRFDKDQNLRLLTFADMYEGIPADAPYFWHFRTGADHDDEPYGLGLAHWLYWPVLFKRNGLKFWLIFLEKFGMPTAKGTYQAGATPAEKTALLSAASAIQTDAGVILPEGMALELLEAARSGTADYKELVTMMDETIAKVTVGNQASMQGSAGKLGEEQLQGEVRRELVKADSDLICESFNLGPAAWLTAWNFPGAKTPRVYRNVDEPEDLQAHATRDAAIAGMGFKPTLDYITETYGSGWEVAPTTPGPGMPFGPSAPGASAPNAGVGTLEFAQGQADPDDVTPIDAQASALTQQAEPAWTVILDAIRHLVDTAPDLPTLRDSLLAMYADLPQQKLGEVMAMGMAAAELAGRYDVHRESGA